MSGGWRTIEVCGWSGGPTVIIASSVRDIVAYLEIQHLAVELERLLGVVGGKEGVVNEEVRADHVGSWELGPLLDS